MTAVAIGLTAIVSAHYLSQIMQKRDQAAALAHSDPALKALAEKTPSAQPRLTTTVFRSVGIDGVVTSTIPGDSKTLFPRDAERK